MKQKRIYQTACSLLRTILYAGICLSAAFSCTSDESSAVDVPAKESDVDITLRIDVPGGNHNHTRALSHTDESEIEGLQVLVFNAADRFQYKAQVGSTEIVDGVGNAYVRLRRSTKGEYYYLVLLANAVELSEPAVGTTKAQVLQQFVFTTKQGNGVVGFPNTSGTRLPVWGESLEQIINSDTEFGEISLYRAVARVDVGVNFQTAADGTIPAENPIALGLANFQLKSVRVYNSLDKGYIAPIEGYGTISIPIDATVYSPNYVDYNVSLATPMQTVREIYLAEVNNHIVDLNEESNPIVSTKDLQERCCLVVGGKYNTDPDQLEATAITYYRIDFLADGKTDETLTDILRNHRYTFNIRSVYGLGYDTPEEAFNNKPVNISVNVAHWDQGLTYADYDGQDNFQCSSKSVSLAYASGSSGKIAVQSNVSPDEWVFENASEWSEALTVTKPADKSGYLTFTAKAYGPLSVEVHMKVHNLTVVFNVSQSDGVYIAPNGVLITEWNGMDNGNESEVPTRPDGVTVDPNNGGVGISDPQTDGNSTFNGGEIEVK